MCAIDYTEAGKRLNRGLPLTATDRITVSVEQRDGTAVIVVGGEIDLNTAPTLEAALADVLADKPAGLVIELSAVDFMGSVGLRILVAGQEEMGGATHFGVVVDGPATRRPIEITGLEETLALYSTLDEAVTALRDRSG